jgi:hypothetical protein
MIYSVPELLVETYRQETEFGRQFKVVVDLSPTDDKTLEVSYDPHEIAFEVEHYDGRLCGRGLTVPH